MLDKTKVPCLYQYLQENSICSKFSRRGGDLLKGRYSLQVQQQVLCNLHEAPKQLVPYEEKWNAIPFSHEAIQTVQAAAASRTLVQHPRQRIWRISDEVCLNILSALLQACEKTSTRACVRPQWGQGRGEDTKTGFFCIIICSFQSNRPTEVVALWYTCSFAKNSTSWEYSDNVIIDSSEM